MENKDGQKLAIHDGKRWVTVGRFYPGDKPKILLDASRNYGQYAKMISDDRGDQRMDSKIYIHVFDHDDR